MRTRPRVKYGNAACRKNHRRRLVESGSALARSVQAGRLREQGVHQDEDAPSKKRRAVRSIQGRWQTLPTQAASVLYVRRSAYLRSRSGELLPEMLGLTGHDPLAREWKGVLLSTPGRQKALALVRQKRRAVQQPSSRLVLRDAQASSVPRLS
jgi:hypothetical protein